MILGMVSQNRQEPGDRETSIILILVTEAEVTVYDEKSMDRMIWRWRDA